MYTLFIHVQLSQDFAQICQKDAIRDSFEEKFPQWAHAIVKYCKETQIRSTAIQAETKDYDTGIEDGVLIITVCVQPGANVLLCVLSWKRYCPCSSNNISLFGTCQVLCTQHLGDEYKYTTHVVILI